MSSDVGWHIRTNCDQWRSTIQCCFTSTETIRLIRDGENGGGQGGWREGQREIIYLSLHCHHQNDSCIKMGSNESHFNVSVGSDGQSHRTVSTNHNLFEEKGEPKQYRTEVLPLTNLTPYRQAKLAHLKTLQRQDHYISHDRPRGYSAYFKGHIPHLLTANPYHQ